MISPDIDKDTGSEGQSPEGQMMHRLMTELFPICRSITGEGVRKTLSLIKNHMPALEVRNIASGQRVFDWTVPREWNIRDAYIKDTHGNKVVDFQKSNLHVLNYSVPVDRRMRLEELKGKLHTIPAHPDWIPYRTSYYKENWGFCLGHNQMLAMEDGEYEVFIDSSLEDGHLSFGEYFIEGQTGEEVLFSTHVCHPSLCNDNLSGVVLMTFLAKHLSQMPLRYSYRFLFIPGTIGSIAWLHMNEKNLFKIKHGLTCACLGDPGGFTYKKTRMGEAEIDRAVTNVLRQSGEKHRVLEFSPFGYDERQYCSPGFNLPVGALMRTPHGGYPEYHTSADNLELVRPESLSGSLRVLRDIVGVLEGNRRYFNLNPKCEPQLGKRGLYTAVGGVSGDRQREMALLWVLNFSDGGHGLLDISDKSGIKFDAVREAAGDLLDAALLEESQTDAKLPGHLEEQSRKNAKNSFQR